MSMSAKSKDIAKAHELGRWDEDGIMNEETFLTEATAQPSASKYLMIGGASLL